MKKFIIVTDPCANIPPELLQKHGIRVIPMPYNLDGREFTANGGESAEEYKAFYDKMRGGASAGTSCACREDCRDTFERVLSEGSDLYYIGFSSALSATYANAREVLDELKAKYHERAVYCTDSLCASLGEGMLVLRAAEWREEGRSISETYTLTERIKSRACHFFTVDNLLWLYKGGRVKKSAFLIAGVLKIKPVLHVDDDGLLTPIGKVFGRKLSLNSLASHIADTIAESEEQTIYIGHGDCPEDAEYLRGKIAEKIKVKGFVINLIDFVIGAHSGPGTVAVFCFGKKR